MVVTPLDLGQIVAQASFLSERLNNGLFQIDAAEVSEQQVSARLTHWCQVVAQGDWEKFQQRLKWNGWDIETVRSVLGAVDLADSQTLLSWAETLREIIQAASEFIFPDSFREFAKSKIIIDPDNPLPFEDLLLPALSVARQKLLTHLGSTSLSPDYLPLELLSEEAYLTLERSLLQRLVRCSSRTLEFEFFHFRPLGQNLFSLLAGETSGNKSRVYYNAFVQKLLSDGLLTFFQKYAVLGRLIATTINFWVEATAELLQRLKTDLYEIQQRFNQFEQTTQPGKVTEIKPFLSDPHNQGRSVIALTFESGLKLVYKPKDVCLEVAYNQFLDWCNQKGVPLAFKVLNLLSRQGYAWIEYVEQLPCDDEAAAQRFYQRAGMLLCLLYVLEGTDCHYENLIASGEHLVLVDMEALLHPEANLITDSPEATETENVVNQKFWDSVMRTGLLPRWDFNRNNHTAHDTSGLGSIDPQQALWPASQWKFINTDRMHLVYEPVTMPIQANVPILNGATLSPNDYLEELVSGFQQMYRFLIERREALVAVDSPLKALQAQKVRFIFRATQVYNVVLQKSLAPEFLGNGIDRSIELDILSRALMTTKEKPKAWPILHSELRAMEQLDIPYFEAFANSDALTVGLEVPIEKYFKRPSYSKVISRLLKLDETDLAQQVAIIKGAFYARIARAPETEQPSPPKALTLLTANLGEISPLTSEQLLQAAQAIAQNIQERAISGTSGSCNWIGFSYAPNVERFQLEPLSVSLYDGNCGIALFLSALDWVRGSTQFRDLVLSALQDLRGFLHASDAKFTQRWVKQIGIGGATGLGSIIYALVRISQFLRLSETLHTRESTALLEDAQQAANLITPELIAVNHQLSIIEGAAGAILGLVALYQETGEFAVLDKAVACGQHLLEHRISIDGTLKAWKTVAQKLLTGFSHGAAGIAYALLRLYSVTQDSAYLEAASEGIAYERSVFSEAAANWPQFHLTEQNGQPVFRVSWCHGAPGIGLARLGGWSIYRTHEICQDVELALQTTQNYSLQGVDHLCCGNLGRTELLLVAAQKLSRPHLRETAQKQAAWVVARAEQTGTYHLFPNLPNSAFNPGFFQGTAGIGYELLRLAYPEALPSVLLWE